MKKTLVALLLLTTSLSAFTLSGCKEKKCSVLPNDYIEQVKVDPTYEKDGIIVKKCDKCGDVTYTILPTLSDHNVYTVSFTEPYFDENGEFIPGYYTYTSDTYGSYNVSHEFFTTYSFNYKTNSIQQNNYTLESISSSHYEFNTDKQAYLYNTEATNERMYYYGYNINNDGSYTFNISQDKSVTYFLFSDYTFSTKLEDGKALISSLSNGKTTFVHIDGVQFGYTSSSLSITVESGEYGEIVKMTQTQSVSLENSTYYQFIGDSQVAIIKLNNPGNKKDIKEVEFATIDYNTQAIEFDSYSKSALTSLSYGFSNIIDLDDSSHPKASSLGSDVKMKLSEDGQSITLKLDGTEKTISIDSFEFSQDVRYDSELDIYYSDYFIKFYCNDTQTPFAGKIQLGQ